MEKKYSVDVQNGELVSIEIDGEIYHSVDEIPEAIDRAYVEFLIEDAKDMEVNGLDFDQEKFLSETRPSKMPMILFGLFLSIAILLLIISAISTVTAIRTMEKEISVPGKVVSMIERRSSAPNYAATTSRARGQSSSGGDMYYYYPEVEITLPDQTTKRIQLGQGSWPPAYEVGQQVTVLYNTEQPSDSSIQSPDSGFLRFLGAIITGFVGLGFFGAAMLVRWITKPGPAEAKETRKAAAVG